MEMKRCGNYGKTQLVETPMYIDGKLVNVVTAHKPESNWREIAVFSAYFIAIAALVVGLIALGRSFG